MFKYRISGVRKKNEREEREKKNSEKRFWVEISLSSCSLVELYVNLQVLVVEKK